MLGHAPVGTLLAALPQVTRRAWRPKPASLAAVFVGALFLVAACGGEYDADMYDAAGVPMEEEPAGEVTAGDTVADGAPDFSLEVFASGDHEKGEIVTLSQFLGQPVVINFWFPSCPPCRLEMPDLEKAYQDHKQDGVQFLGVQLLGLDSASDGQEFVDEFNVNYAIGPDEDGSITRDYGVRNFPTTVFLTRDHEVSKKWAGLLDHEKLEELIQRAMAE